MAWIEFLDEVTKNFAEKTALVEQESGRSLTYRDLQKEVDAWAWTLQDLGVKKGERVAFLSTNCLEHVTLFLACARLGALFVPMNFRLAAGELLEIIARITPKVFIGVDECELDLSKDLPYYPLKDLKPLYEKGPFPTVPSDDQAPLLMLFTSGTTGTPKGVLFHGQMLASNQRETCKNWGLRSTDRTLVETPFFHTGGYNVLCLPLMSLGGTSLLSAKFDLDNIYETIEKEKLSVYFAVPTMFQMLAEDARFKDFSFDSMRFFISGGAYCPKELIEEYQKKGLMFKQGFGLTEVGPNCFLLKEEDSIDKVGSIGKPMPHSKVMLLTDEGKPAGVNEIGELLIKGPHVCAGYFRQPERFNDVTFDGYFKTGDLARVDEDGFYYIVGRKKDMYISGGENVYPAEVERKILSHQDIHEAVVVAVPSQKWGEVGYCYLRSERDFAVEELRDYLNPLLSRYKHPHYVECVKKFPILANGKIDRKALKEKAVALAL